MSSVWRSASSYKRGLLNLVSANHICNHIPRIMPNLCVCQGFDMLAQSDDYHALFAHLAVGKINNEIQHQFRQQALRAGSKPRRGFGHCQRLHLTAFSNTRKSFLGISSTVYGRMTLAIKAILSVSRVAPCFRLAQRQQKDNFQIHYQYTVGPPNLSLLGEDMQTRRIAAVATPVGTISVSLSYTTNLQMPYKVRKGTMFHVKDDHFSQPSVGHFSEPKPCNRKFRNPTSVEDLRFLESQEKQDTFNTMFSTSPPEGMSPPMPQIQELIKDGLDGNQNQQQSPEDKDPFNDYYRSAVFLHGEGKAVQMERPEDRPFATLMAGLPMPGADASDSSPSDHSDTGQEAKEDGEEGQKEEEEEEEGSSSDASDRTEEGARSQSPTTSDFVMLPPLEFPFADTDPTTDLGQFYREMQSAPQLSMCEEHTVGFDEYLADIKGQIDRYTACQPNFEKFVKSICKEGEELSD